MKRSNIVIITMLLIIVSGGFVSANPYMISQPQYVKTGEDLNNPYVVYKVTINNTAIIPYVLIDQDGNYLVTLPLNLTTGDVIDMSNTSGHWIVTVNTSTQVDPNTEQIPGEIAVINDGTTTTNITKGAIWYNNGTVIFKLTFYVVRYTDTNTNSTSTKVYIQVNSIDHAYDLQPTYYRDVQVPEFINGNPGILRIMLYNIEDNGNAIKIANIFDNLTEGDYVSGYHGPLMFVLSPVEVNENVDFTPYVHTITGIELSNMTSASSDFLTVSFPSTNVAHIDAQLGDGRDGGAPRSMDIYFKIKLEPIVNTTEPIMLSDELYKLTVVLNNTNNNVTLGPGYVTIEGIAPNSALKQINESISSSDNNVKIISVEPGFSGVKVKLFYNNTVPSQGTRVFSLTYEYTDPFTAKVNEILKYLKDINTTTHDSNDKLNNVILSLANVTTTLDQIVNMLTEMSNKTSGSNNNGGVVEVNFSEVLNAISQLQDNDVQIMDTLNGMSDTLSNISNNMNTLVTMMNDQNTNIANLEDKINQIYNVVSQLSTGGNNGGQIDLESINMVTDFKNYINDYTTMIDNFVSNLQNPDKYSDDVQRLMDIKDKLTEISSNYDTLSSLDSSNVPVAMSIFSAKATTYITEAIVIMNRIKLEELNTGNGQTQVSSELSAKIDNLTTTINEMNAKLNSMNNEIVVVKQTVSSLGSHNTGGTGATTTGQGTTTVNKNKQLALLLILVAVGLAGYLVVKMKKAKSEEEEEEEEGEYEEEYEEEEEEEEEEEF